MSGKKGDLLLRLKDALITNLPVLDGPVERDAGMTGLDVTAEWVLLEPDPIPIAEPANKDGTLRPPTERDAPVNPKYRYNETFEHQSFLGTTEDMSYMASYNLPYRKKGQRRRKLSPTRQHQPAHGERVMGGGECILPKEAWAR